AKAVIPGFKPSDVPTRTYIFLDSTVRNFSSNLPIVVVDTFGKNIGQTAHTSSFTGVIEGPARGRVRMTTPPTFVSRAGINIRGQSSAGFAKHQYHLETWDEFDQDKDVSILGFPPESDWILQGPYSDKSLMRNFLSYQWSNDIGRYAVRSKFVEVFLNTDGRDVSLSDYIGVYVFMEKIKRSPDRVNITQLEPADNEEPFITGGYLFKKDKLDSGEPTFSTGRVTLIYVDPNGWDITQPQKDWLKNYLTEFEAVLYGSNYTDPAEGYAKYIDVDSFIDHHILVELTKNIDGFRISTFMFKDRGGKLNIGPIWDYNLSLGNADYLDGWLPTGWYNELVSEGDYPWWRRLFQDPSFQMRYADRWFALRENLFADDRLLGDIDQTAALLNEAQARNFDRWKILGVHIWPNPDTVDAAYKAAFGTYEGEIGWMRNWLESRLAWMDGRIALEFAEAPPAFSLEGGHFDRSIELEMIAPVGAIYYTLDGNDPFQPTMSQGGNGILVSESTEKRVLVPIRPIGSNWTSPTGFNDSQWTRSSSSLGGVGYERDSGYEGLISLNVEPQMYTRSSTCFIRIPFSSSAGPDAFKTLTLSIRYDDGFVAYLNGVEIARRNFTGTPTWNSSADAEHPDSEAVEFESIDVSASLSALRQGSNLLAIHGLNSSASDSDFLISSELFAGGEDPDTGDMPGLVKYTSPVSLTATTHVKARVLNRGRWSALNEAVFAVGPVAENLRITEIMYHPKARGNADEPNEEFIELKNIGTESVNLNLVSFTNGIEFTFPNVELVPGEYVLVVQDRSAFEGRYGSNLNIAGQYSGKLDNAGERIRLEDAVGQTILDFNYRDTWRALTDGEGFSLTIIDPMNPDLNSWDEKDSWRASAYAAGSPGQDDSGIVPNPGDVVINEILAHAHAEASDWIELYNTTDKTIDIGGWFLSDSKDNLFKYQIAGGSTIDPYGYIVFYQDQQFGSTNDPGSYEPFALSENGEQVYLSSTHNGVLTGYRAVEDFGPSVTGVSFGRYYKASTNNYNFVAMETATEGSANSYPKVGPVVISEIMYNPDWPLGGSYTNEQYEYIELHNISSQPVTLYDYATAEPWKFTDGVEFTFPADMPVTIPPGGYILVVKKPEAFSWRYPGAAADQILGPYDGSLNNSGERLELSMPGDVDGQGNRYYIRIDRVDYSDGSHPEDTAGSIDLWPIEADGYGLSLTRKVPADYANDPENWTASVPSPGE
ncbi:MAG: CotH kinase family protein, partial [Planctomycetota bacterium]